MKQREKVEEQVPEIILFQVSATPHGLQVRGTEDLNVTQRLALAEVLRLAAEGLHGSLFDDFLMGGNGDE